MKTTTLSSCCYDDVVHAVSSAWAKANFLSERQFRPQARRGSAA
jgi:hypothetical protein